MQQTHKSQCGFLHPGLTGELVFPAVLPSIPSFWPSWWVGSPCITRAPRSCSADPLSPGSAALTFQLSTAHCCSQMSTALRLGPSCPPRLHCYLRSASAFLTPALGGVFLQQGCPSEDRVRFISEVVGFISFHYSFVFLESKVLLQELGEAVLGQGTVR